MSENMRRTSLPIVLLASVIAGCSGLRDRAPVTTPRPREDKTVSQWKMIYTIAAVDGENRRVHRGYLEHRFSPTSDESIVYMVYNENRRPVGFVLPSGTVYAYRRDVSGNMTTREVGHDELDDAVLKLLRTSGVIEYADVTPGTQEESNLPSTRESIPSPAGP